MPTKRRDGAKARAKKTQRALRGMALRMHARRDEQGHNGLGEDCYQVEVRPKSEFKIFRFHKIGHSGGIIRVSGQRESGSWGTQRWLIAKSIAHIEDGKLMADHDDVRAIFDQIGTAPIHVRDDRFRVKSRQGAAKPQRSSSAQDLRPQPST